MTTEHSAGALLAAGRRDDWCQCPLHTLFPQRISDLVDPTLNDLKAACALIGADTYGKPHWTPETINPHNPVVQAFARHARLATRTPTPARNDPAAGGAKEPWRSPA